MQLRAWVHTSEHHMLHVFTDLQLCQHCNATPIYSKHKCKLHVPCTMSLYTIMYTKQICTILMYCDTMLYACTMYYIAVHYHVY
jgi:hypothetical protein